jgi:hypothetical protein
VNYNSRSTVQNSGTLTGKTKNQGKGRGPPGVAVMADWRGRMTLGLRRRRFVVIQTELFTWSCRGTTEDHFRASLVKVGGREVH